MRETLIELLNIIFQRDNKAITDIVEKFSYAESDYTRPPEDVENLVDNLLNLDNHNINCEFVGGQHYTEETTQSGFKIEKGAVELWFKFKDVKLKRRKIFRLGDYYLKIINNGFDKWHYLFYIKAPQVVDGELIESYLLASHPHISVGNACFASMETGIRAAITNYNFNGFLWRIRTFLSSWNYRSPHHHPEYFEQRNVIVFDTDSTKFMLEPVNDHGHNYLKNSYALDAEEALNYEKKTFMLTSARCKAYDDEPISRLAYHFNHGTTYIDGYKVGNMTRFINSYNLLHSLAKWLKSKHNTEYPLSYNEYYVLAVYALEKLTQTISSSELKFTGTWCPEFANELRCDINSTLECLYHNRNIFKESHDGRLSRSANYVWYLGSGADNKDNLEESMSLIKQLNELKNTISTYRDKCEFDAGPNFQDVRCKVFNELTSIFVNFDEEPLFDRVSDFIKLIDDYTIDMQESTNVEELLADIQEKYYSISSKLTSYYKQHIINYHKQELRRLEENGRQRKHIVQIENLNL